MASSPRWTGAQRRIGLTGGIASGKSTVARWLERQGLPVLDADLFAREALAPGSPGAAAVLAHFGEAVRAQGSPSAAAVIDRGALGQIVFHAPEQRRWLEELVHPLVRQQFEAELTNLAAEPTVVLVIPLLFEVGLEGLCSEIWLVDCEPEQQLKRLMERDGLDEVDAQSRISSQMPLDSKRQLADQIIDNRGSRELMSTRLENLLNRYGRATL